MNDMFGMPLDVGDKVYYIGNTGKTGISVTISEITEIRKRIKIKSLHPAQKSMWNTPGTESWCERHRLIKLGVPYDRSE